MKSPAGEVREVVATTENLTPLMAKGWHQTNEKPAAPAEEEK